MILNTNLVTKAKQFAEHAHKDHVRNDAAKTPYILHLQEVAELVEKSGGSDLEVAAAWLHDTIEDTPTTIEDIQREFGSEVAEVVHGLTDLPEFLELTLAARKAKQAERIKTESPSVQRVKLADQTSNVQIIGGGDQGYDSDTNITYIEGAKKIADACKGVYTFLDNEFAERYAVAQQNLSNK